MQKEKKEHILVISSADPTKGPGVIGMDMYDAFLERGYSVDMLTTYRVKSRPDVRYIYKKPSRWRSFRFKFYWRLSPKPDRSYCFFYRKESFPPISCSKVLAALGEHYDRIVILFWQEMLSFRTVLELHRKYHSRFYFVCADYSPMSGGCHFTGDCHRFKSGCGACPAFHSVDPKDFTHWNVEYRKKVYELVRPVLYANTYMIENFFKKSILLKNQNLQKLPTILDLKFYHPIDKYEACTHFGLPLNKRNVIVFGCQNLTDPRKGIVEFLFDSLDRVYEHLTEDERQQTMVVYAGKDGENFSSHFKFENYYIGSLNPEDLPFFYSAATMFVCPSVNDAGPSMVYQAMACGTPVVAFAMGAALDAVRGRNTGYCARLKDADDLAQGMLHEIQLTPEQYRQQSNECIAVAEALTSKEAFVKAIINN